MAVDLANRGRMIYYAYFCFFTLKTDVQHNTLVRECAFSCCRNRYHESHIPTSNTSSNQALGISDHLLIYYDPGPLALDQDQMYKTELVVLSP